MSMSSRLACETTTSGGWPSTAYARSAVRIWPMRVAASALCPWTSPMTRATWLSGSGITSYQSPPTSRPAVVGR